MLNKNQKSAAKVLSKSLPGPGKVNQAIREGISAVNTINRFPAN